MADLGPFRTIVDLNAPPPTITLVSPLVDLAVEFWNATESGWGDACDPSDWDGAAYITWTIRSVEHFWDGNPQWVTPDGVIDADPSALPDIGQLLAWSAGQYSYEYRTEPAFPPLLGHAGRWVPLTGDPVADNEGFRQGATVVLRHWGHRATGPRQCIAGNSYPLIQETGRLEIASPPETRDDLTVFPGEVRLTFTDQVVAGVAYEPIGISTSYSRSGDSSWLGGEQPRLQVLYRVKR